jgi:hypothetical protein
MSRTLSEHIPSIWKSCVLDVSGADDIPYRCRDFPRSTTALPRIEAPSKMQPFKGKLTDEQIKDSVDYFRTFVKEAGKSARPTFFEAGRVGKHVMVVVATFYGFSGRKVWSLIRARTRNPLVGRVAREVSSAKPQI